ncbi:MAG: outer membrane protein assembly factor, partial [bacterium]
PTVRKSRVLIFEVHEGNQVRVGSVSISGNRTVRTAIISREIVIEPQEIFDPGKAYESQRRIYATGLFKDVRFEVVGETEKKDRIDLVFHVAEGQARWISIGGGYQSPDRISFYMHWGHDNIFNNGQKLKLETSYSFNLRGEHEENFGITHREPYLFSSSFQGELHLFHNREYWERYDVIESGGNSRVGRYIGEHIEVFAQYQFKTASTKIHPGGDTTVTEIDTLSTVTNSISISATRDSRDNIFDPRKGTLSSFRAEYAGGFLGGHNDFYRLVADISAFYNPIARIVFATRARGGLIEPFGRSTAIPFEERFALRGSDAIRGYDEQNLVAGGYYLTTFNVEMRFPLFRIYGKYLGLAYFVDMGNVWRVPLRLKDLVKDLNVGAGAGIRVETPIGPLRLDYARNITDTSITDYGKIYFGIGHMF